MTRADTVSTGPVARVSEPGLALFLGLLGALTILRLIGQYFSVVDLDVDEAQYWDWSRELAFGYFSKPPLIAWVNAGASLVCGESVACIRAPAPLFYFGTSLLIYGTTRVLYGATAAFWAGLTVAVAIASRSRCGS
ncbi:MAG: glycosyltransferase family 39 protein [Bauldia sp.]